MAWSPDGQWIAFKGQTRDGSTELAVVHVEGHRQGFRVLLPAAIPDMTDLLHNPSWSPGGTQILAAVITKANPARQLYLLDAAGNGLRSSSGIGAGSLVQRYGLVAGWDTYCRQHTADFRRAGRSMAECAAGAAHCSCAANVFAHSAGRARQPTVGPAVDLLPSDARELVSRYERAKAVIKTTAAGQVRDRATVDRGTQAVAGQLHRDAKLNGAVAVRDLIRALTPPVVSILPDTGSLSRYNSQVGGVFYFRVTGRVDGSVWGTDGYTAIPRWPQPPYMRAYYNLGKPAL